jgi:AraC-like DNA-binding protein
MQLIRYQPAPPLDRYIECFWYSDRRVPVDHSEHMLPSGQAQLLFALHELPILCRSAGSEESITWSRSIVHGPQSSYYIAGPKPKGGVVGVSFRPGGAGAVLGVPMAELADCHVALDAIWGTRGMDLHHRLLSAIEPGEMFRILDKSLSARICRPLLIHPAVARTLAPQPADVSSTAGIADIQRASGYSPKHFIAMFHSAVGLTPKRYYRIRRFNWAVRHMAVGRGSGLAAIAAAAGYSDQAHMSREFRELAGVAPSKYQPTSDERPLHHRAATELPWKPR